MAGNLRLRQDGVAPANVRLPPSHQGHHARVDLDRFLPSRSPCSGRSVGVDELRKLIKASPDPTAICTVESHFRLLRRSGMTYYFIIALMHSNVNT